MRARTCVSLLVLGAGFLAVASPARSTHIDGLEGFWKFDEGSGSTAVDSSGHGRDGMILGPVYSTDASPAAGSTFSLSFDGMDDTVSVADTSALDFSGGDEFTAALWFKKSASPAFYHLLGKRVECGAPLSDINYQLAKDRQGLHFNSGGGRVDTSVLDVPEGSWTHFAATYDPAAHVLKVYVNGVERGSASDYTLGGVAHVPLTIGDSGGCPTLFPGKIDDVRIYRRTLSASEIAALAAAPTARCDQTIVIRGTSGPDTLVGTPADEKFIAGAGDDHVLSDGGEDCLLGQAGDDTLRGGPQDDQVRGGTGNERIHGGHGNDILLGGFGHDRIVANDGEADQINCGAGIDTAIVDTTDSFSNCEVVIVRAPPEEDTGD